jgi:hypothetical protein
MSESIKNPINRREALRRTALLLGGVVSAPTALGFLNGCSAKTTGSSSFTDEQSAFLTRISDIMIPATDTPGAADVGVVNYVSDMVFVMYDDEEKASFLSDMEGFMSKAEASLGKPFNEASPKEQSDFIHAEHELVFGGDVDWNAPKPFIWKMKELTITGYFSSEAGMTQVLQYTQVPGRYDACVPFSEAGEGGRVHAI